MTTPPNAAEIQLARRFLEVSEALMSHHMCSLHENEVWVRLTLIYLSLIHGTSSRRILWTVAYLRSGSGILQALHGPAGACGKEPRSDHSRSALSFGTPGAHPWRSNPALVPSCGHRNLGRAIRMLGHPSAGHDTQDQPTLRIVQQVRLPPKKTRGAVQGVARRPEAILPKEMQ